MSEANALRIKNNRAQVLIKIEQSVLVDSQKAEVHIKRTWRDLERIFTETRFVKTETGWRRIRDMLEDVTFPEDEVETEVVDVTASNRNSLSKKEAK